jgi:hypothetical protein
MELEEKEEEKEEERTVRMDVRLIVEEAIKIEKLVKSKKKHGRNDESVGNWMVIRNRM